MAREIFEVYAKVVDANGAYNTLSGYPKVFDSNSYSNDVNKARQRAYGDYHEVLGAMCKVDTRQIQLAMIIDVSSGVQIEVARIGELADLPEPNGET